MFRVTRWMFVAVLCLGLGAGCGRKAPATTDTAAAGVRVTDVELGRGISGDRRVTDQTSTFHPNDVIYASILTSGSATDARLRARWTYQDGQVVDDSQQQIAPTGDAATEFHVSKPDGWPAGKYKLEVFLNDNPVQTKEFSVE